MDPVAFISSTAQAAGVANEDVKGGGMTAFYLAIQGAWEVVPLFMRALRAGWGARRLWRVALARAPTKTKEV